MAAKVTTPWADLLPLVVETLTHGGGWSPITCDVSAVHVSGGRAEWSAAMDPALLSATLVNVAGNVTVKAGDRIRLSTGHHQLFQGRIHDASRRATPDGTATVVLRAADDLRQLATTALEERDVNDPLAAVGTGDTYAERMNRILDLAHWPANMRQLDTSLNWRLEGTWFGRSALDEIHLLSRSIGGWAYLTRDGKIATGFPDAANTTRWHVVAEPSPADPGAVCASKFKADMALEYVVNDVFLRAHGSGMSWATSRDVASQTKYGVRSYVAEGLQSLHYLSDLAAKIIQHSAEPRERLRSVTVPIVDANAASMFDQFRIGDAIDLTYRHPAGWGFNHDEGYVVAWTLDVDHDRATATYTTGHPLDTRPQTSTATGASGGGSGGPGPAGPTGPQGPRGATWTHDDGPPTATKPPAPHGGWIIGDAYMDRLSGKLYIYTNTGWHDEGVDLTGPEGPIGPHGTAVHVLGTVPTVGDLPKPGGPNPPADADVHFVTGTGDLYIWEHLPGDPAGGQWHDMGHVTGPQGPRGPKGATGQISDAHGDVRYVQKGDVPNLPFVKKAGDTMSGPLSVNAAVHANHELSVGTVAADTNGKLLVALNAARPQQLRQHGTGSAAGIGWNYPDGKHVVFLMNGKAVAWLSGYGTLQVGAAPRPHSEVRNVSHGPSGPPSDMKPGDIHLQY